MKKEKADGSLRDYMDRKIKKMVRNEYVGFAFAVLCTWLVKVIMLLLLSLLLFRIGLTESMVSIGILLTYFAGNFTGGFIAGKSVFGKHYLAGCIAGAIDFVLLLVFSLLINGTIRDFGGNFFTTLVICVGSGALGGICCAVKKKKL